MPHSQQTLLKSALYFFVLFPWIMLAVEWMPDAWATWVRAMVAGVVAALVMVGWGKMFERLLSSASAGHAG